MRIGNPLEALAQSLAHAQYEGFGEVEYEDRDWEHYRKTKEDRRIKKTRKHSAYDISVYSMFPQSWSSTALGFGGIGGQAITPAYTVIVESDHTGEYCVYFGGRFAYRVKSLTQKFRDDVARQYMAEVSEAHKYETSN
jgi:hypothetical protein